MNAAEFSRQFPAKASCKEDNDFRLWMAQVDVLILRKTGVTSNDLPDFCYRDAFDDGATPNKAAQRAIKAAKEDF